MLFIVSTPIGNLGDITLRALETLKSVDLIAAEDTRHTRNLLQHFEIITPLTSYFDHNESFKSKQLVDMMKEGKKIALVSDAGTPGISDPGYRLIHLAKENNIPVTVIPGPCAAIAALSLSGLPAHAFVFEGFLPVKKEGRRKKLASFLDEDRTVIVYESTHRILKALEDIHEVLGDRTIVVCREISKKFEEVAQGTALELLTRFNQHACRGEIVLLIKGVD